MLSQRASAWLQDPDHLTSQANQILTAVVQVRAAAAGPRRTDASPPVLGVAAPCDLGSGVALALLLSRALAGHAAGAAQRAGAARRDVRAPQCAR
eukprot:5643931-Prymnesium_polylepis.1